MPTAISPSGKRVIVVCVFALLGFLAIGIAFHQVARTMISGAMTISLLLLILPAFARKKKDES
jgi:hypothetical protein